MPLSAPVGFATRTSDPGGALASLPPTPSGAMPPVGSTCGTRSWRRPGHAVLRLRLPAAPDNLAVRSLRRSLAPAPSGGAELFGLGRLLLNPRVGARLRVSAGQMGSFYHDLLTRHLSQGAEFERGDAGRVGFLTWKIPRILPPRFAPHGFGCSAHRAEWRHLPLTYLVARDGGPKCSSARPVSRRRPLAPFHRGLVCAPGQIQG